MKHFFAPAYFNDGDLAPWTYLGTDEQTAWETVCKLSEECPYDYFCYDESDKTLYVHENGWKPWGRVWFVVRHNPGFSYPETVISKDGIFDTLAETEAYIKKHGGSWKMYDFNELQYKMAESIQLMQRLKSEQQEKECPF